MRLQHRSCASQRSPPEASRKYTTRSLRRKSVLQWIHMEWWTQERIVYPLFLAMLSNLVIRPPVHIKSLGERKSSVPINLGRLAWGVGQLSGTRQKWVLDRAEVHNLAKQHAGVHSCRAQPTLNPAILSAHARRRLVPLMQSWQHLAKCVGLRPKCLNRTPISEARREYAPCAICVSPSFREAGGGLWPLKARTHPWRSVARRLSISHRPNPPPPDDHPPASFPGNKTTRRCTDPRGPHGLVKYRETNRLYISVSQRRRSI